jgi:hypothetical protein
MAVIKVANLQSNLGFVVSAGAKRADKISLDEIQLSRRIFSISKLIQLHRVRGFELIRVGGLGDGGYVMLDNFTEIDGVLSFGVGPDVSWDLDISRKTPLIHLYDHTVSGLPASIPNGIWFKEKIVSTGDLTGTSITEAIERLPNSNNLILKSDIEDSEWDIFAKCPTEVLLKFDQIVIEFHWLSDKICGGQYELMFSAFENLSQTHSVVNIHANNYANYEIIANCPVPSVIEVTYVRTKSYEIEKALNEINLNAPNFKDKPEINLSFPIQI